VSLRRLHTAAPADAWRFAMPTELTFLALRAAQLREIADLMSSGTSVIADWAPFKQRIYATLTLTATDRLLLEQTYDLWISGLPSPHLLVNLRAEPQVLLQRVKGRGRLMEAGITVSHLSELAVAYDRYVASLPAQAAILSLDVTRFNVFDAGQLAGVIAAIRAALSAAGRADHG
jgi:deoxyguanosine kinase